MSPRIAIALSLALLACGEAVDRVPQETVAADAWCELSADMFCDYYLRCDRMAVDDLAECRAVFADACETRYEPHYVALAEDGWLALSVEGLGACAAHLRTVDCDTQIFDLDGACGAAWVGLGGPGDPCGPGIESFTCGDGTTCRLGLDFCGTCEPTVPAGARCDDARCADGTSCVGGTCVVDALPGEACGEGLRECVLGAWCDDGICARPIVVGAGEPCDRTHRCPYRATCVDGTCVVGGLIGEACDPATPCASGWCDGGTCAAQLPGGAACATGAACLSGVCDGGTCVDLPGVCF